MNIAAFGAIFDTSGVKKGADDFASSMDKVKKKAAEANDATEKSSDSLKDLKTALEAAGAAFAINKISSFIKEVTLLSSRYDELGVVLGTIGKNAGYNNTQLAQLEKELKKTGISALQSRQSITSMIQAQLDLTQASKLARVAQDAAVIGQLNSSDALNRIIYGIKTAQTETLRTVGINVNFEEGYRKLANTLNKNVSELTQAEKAQARVNVVMDSGKEIAGAYEAAMDNAGKQLRSAERYAEDLKVAIGEVFQPAFTLAVKAYAGTLEFLQQNVVYVQGAMIVAASATAVFSAALLVLTVRIKAMAAIESLTVALKAYRAAAAAGTLATVAFGTALRVALIASGVGAVVAGIGFVIYKLAQRFKGAKDEVKDFTNASTQMSNALQDKVVPALRAEFRTNEQLIESFKLLNWHRKQAASPVIATEDPAGVKDLKDKAAETRAEVERLAEARRVGGEKGFKAEQRNIQILKMARSAWEDAAKAGEEAMEAQNTWNSALTSTDPAVRNAVATYRQYAAGLYDADAALTRVSDSTTDLRDRTEDIVALQDKLNALRVRATGDVRKAAEVEQRANLKAYEASVRKEQSEGRVSKAQADRLITLNAQVVAEERLIESQQRSKSITEEVRRANEELSVMMLQAQGRTKDAADLSARLSLQEEERSIAARRASGEISGFTALYLTGLARIRDAVRRNATEVARSREEQATLERASVEANVAVLTSMGKLNEAKKLESDYRQRIYEQSVRQAVVEGRITEEAGERLIQLSRVTNALGTVVQDTTDQTKAMYENLARGISSSMSEAFFGIATKGLKTFADFFDSVRDLFLRMLSEIAAQAVTKRLLAPVAALLGVAGAPGSASGQSVAGIDLSTIGDASFGQRTTGQNLLGGLGGALAGGTIGYSSGSPLLGGLSGAAAGFAMGGPLGAVVGGVGGVIGGLIGLGSKAAKIQREYDRINGEFTKSYDAFLKGFSDYYDGFVGEQRKLTEQFDEVSMEAIKVFRQSPLGNEIRNRFGVDLAVLNKIFKEEGVDGIKELRDGLKNVVGSTEDIDTLIKRLEELGDKGQEALQKLIKAEEDRLRQISEDLDLRLAETRLSGADDPDGLMAQRIENRRLELRQQREIQDAIKDGWDEVQIATLKAIHAEEWLALERNRAADQIKKDAEEAKRLREEAYTREEFGLDLMRRRAELSGDTEQIMYARAATLAYRQKRELEAAQELLDAGIITVEMFEELTGILKDEFAAAMDETAIAAENAARIMRENLSALNQEAELFGYSIEEQIKRTADLFGFNGMSDDEIKALYTKYTPGQELTESQKKVNDEVATYFRLIAQRDAQSSSSAIDVTGGGRVTPDGTVFTGPVSVVVNLNLTADEIRDGDRTADKIAARVSRILAGERVTINGAAGLY